ncbi:hypothetical protein KVR01_011828 [Diaporthe batatas]|uniref:uncharacterized protein n=1 Tax=Diaporthe batatas TaxID=748121 RepID=UPI001D0546B1|nr:uncharacterized protein KVR01_011828 [Diaporthe batatas]KAG8158067.1 hypothetical protein KVR01_011828 [Diaporthe batatas]
MSSLGLRPAVPVAARQTMQCAFSDLEKILTPEDSEKYRDFSLERVRQEAINIENQLGSRGWLRNMRRLEPLFTGLEHYSKVVDIICNGTPYLPWVWAPITLVLRIASEHIESFDSIIGAYSRIGSSLQRFEVIQKSFMGDPKFHETTAAVYADILEFHKYAYKFVRRSGWKLLFSTSWGRFQRRFDHLLKDMKEHIDLVDRLANAIDIAEAHQMRQDVYSWREESLQRIILEEREQSAKQFSAIQSWLRMNECDQLAIFESVAGQGSKYPGTCGWILNHAKIKSWVQRSSQTPILWLSGTAGSGKSVLSSQLIKFIKSRNDVVLHHFCTNTSVASSEYDQVLKSMLEQLLRQDGDFTANVYNEYVLKKQVASIPALEQLLQTLLANSAGQPSQCSYVWIVLDGVDELRDHSPNSQARLLNFIKQIVSKTSASENVICKVFISSRPTTTVSHVLRHKPSVSLTKEKEHLGSAIREYALQRLRALDTRFQQLGLSGVEIDSMGEQISQKSDGMFLYARLVLDFVSSNIFVRGDELRKSINELPRELSSFYSKLLSQILAPLDQNSTRHIKCIFGWVAYARRPLRRSELLSAVCFSSGDPEVEYPAPQYILDVCRSLIDERSDTTLTFIHVSVKEFLQSSSSNLEISEETAVKQHCTASVACLLSSIKLLAPDRQEILRVLVRGVYGFQLYAAEYWTEDLLAIVDWSGGLDRSSALYNLLCKFSADMDATFENDGHGIIPGEPAQDERLNHLKDHQLIYRHVREARWARSLKQLEKRLKFESPLPDATQEGPAPVIEGVSALLSQYQRLLLHVINEPDIPGVSPRDVETFRNEFCTSAHSCRLGSCPRATVGFETERLRIEHEKSHVRRYPCTHLGCQYPPFLTPGSLKKHIRKEHETVKPPKSIPRVKAAVNNPIMKTNHLTRDAFDDSLTDFDFDSFLHAEDEIFDFGSFMRGTEDTGYENSGRPSRSHSPSSVNLRHQSRLTPQDYVHPYPEPSASTPDVTPARRSGQAVQDYQLQLMMQEQMKKKRLMMERQQRDDISIGANENKVEELPVPDNMNVLHNGQPVSDATPSERPYKPLIDRETMTILMQKQNEGLARQFSSKSRTGELSGSTNPDRSPFKKGSPLDPSFQTTSASNPFSNPFLSNNPAQQQEWQRQRLEALQHEQRQMMARQMQGGILREQGPMHLNNITQTTGPAYNHDNDPANGQFMLAQPDADHWAPWPLPPHAAPTHPGLPASRSRR